MAPMAGNDRAALVRKKLERANEHLASLTAEVKAFLDSGPYVVNSRSGPLPGPPGIGAKSCCKICTIGKACGDTCISRQYTCHVGPGCACDANP